MDLLLMTSLVARVLAAPVAVSACEPVRWTLGVLALLVVMTPWAAAAQGFSVGVRVDFATGVEPFSVAIGDVSGDARPDLVTANSGANTVSVLLGLVKTRTAVHLGDDRLFGSISATQQQLVIAAASVDVADGGTMSFALEAVQPNPTTSGRMNVVLVLPIAAPARLELVDVRGRMIAARDIGSLGAGRHVVDLAGERKLGAGVYVVRLTQGPLQRTTRALVLD